MFSLKFSVAACALIALSTADFASAQKDPPSNVAAEVQRITEKMTVMNARLAELELRAKITAKEREISLASGSAPSSPLGSSAGNPSVASVAGLKGNLEAVLVFPGGLVQRVKVGDVIGDRSVSVVSINQVILTDTKTKGVTRLAFGTSAVVKEQASTQNSFPGSPMSLPGSPFPPPPPPPPPTR